MSIARATRQPARYHALAACRKVMLCAGIAAVLGGWIDLAHAASATAVEASGAEASFDRTLLSGAGQNTSDLSRFEHGNPVLPGSYSADLYLNNAPTGRANVRFAAISAPASATPCVDRKLLDQLNLHPANLSPEILAQMQDPTACVGIDSVIPGASLSFDMTNLRLEASVPQAFLGQTPRGYVSPEYWDAGVPAALLNYNFNSYHTSSQGLNQTSAYLGLNFGLNIGAWHLRQDSTVIWQSSTSNSPSRSQWQNINTYVQRDLPSLRAQLTVGDSYTDGQVFDSYGLRGVQLATDDRMLPDSLRGYAPVIQGIAQTNAKVTVRQNGQIIYQTTVAPGPFTVNDLYPTGYGGSLDVSVTEADGRVRTFSVPYASVAQLLRPGTTRFDIAIGELRYASIKDKPTVGQATIQHGFSNLLTGYAGVIGSEGYAAALVGSAINTRFGAIALDITQARAEIPGYATQSGQSTRLTYSKILPETNTSLSVAAYRYSTSGYLSLTDAALARDYAQRGIDAFTYVPPAAVPTIDGVPVQSLLTPAQQAALSGTSYNPYLSGTGLQRQRNRFTLTLSQRLGESGGSLYANTAANDYWNRSGTDTQFQVGYSNAFRHFSFNVSATRARDPLGRYDNQYFASFSVPLGSTPHAPTLSFNASHDESGGTQEQAMVNGSAGVDNQFTYGVSASHSDSGSTGNAGTVNAGYRGPYAVLSASFGSGSGYSQASFGMSGAVVAHPGGVTFGQPMGDTVGIIEVPGAAGARLGSSSGARIDRFGYALVPYLTPYNLNTITIDPKGLPLDVQLNSTSVQVAPHAGAVVMLKFKTDNGRTIVVRARMPDGQALPFGTEVFNEKNIVLGLVGQAGQILVRGVEQSGLLTARWQDDAGQAQSCSFSYQLGPKAKGKTATSYEEVNVTCERPQVVAQVTRSGT
ncbi:fimbria/pilus outer membrane usher protein [Dyella sp. Tek66A03]|uniref:fimbria/pilus outer membrane usher protein n=1 Tax=Dyella sp. Tek66A03 TaxID=3458298 RepID=UPI00403E5299